MLKSKYKKYLPDADVYIIGSIANDKLKRGDIDILVIKKKRRFNKAVVQPAFLLCVRKKLWTAAIWQGKDSRP